MSTVLMYYDSEMKRLQAPESPRQQSACAGGEEYLSLVHLQSDSPRTLEQLQHDIQRGETRLVFIHGEVIRQVKVAAINVFYRTRDGRRYQLFEERYTLRPGKSLDDFKRNPEEAAQPSHPRRHIASVTERMVWGKTPREEAARGVFEEMFAHQMPSVEEQAAIMRLIASRLHVASVFRLDERAADDPSASYRGLPTQLFIYDGTITFDHNDVCIPQENGEPPSLFEYLPEQGYVNVFRWKSVDTVAR